MAHGLKSGYARARYTYPVAKTSVEIDKDIVRQAAEILGTKTLNDTIHAALQDVLHAKRRLELISLLAGAGRFDFELAEHAWGGDQ